MAITGVGGGVYVGSTKVAEIANWSLDMEADDIDTTNFDSNGWKELMQGLKEWSGSFEGNFKPDDTNGQAALINAWLSGNSVTLDLRVNTAVKFAGSAFIKPSIETPNDDKVSFSCDYQGTGALTPTLAAA